MQDSGEFGRSGRPGSDHGPLFWFEKKAQANSFKKHVLEFLYHYHVNWDNLDEMVSAPAFKKISSKRDNHVQDAPAPTFYTGKPWDAFIKYRSIMDAVHWREGLPLPPEE